MYKKVLLAIDVFGEDPSLETTLLSALESFFHGHPVQIVPLTVASSTEDLSQCKDKLQAWERSTRLTGRVPGEIVVCETSQLVDAVRTLLSYAEKNNFDLIATSTQPKKGGTRFVFGSFAQELIHQSPLDLLIVGPHCQSQTPPIQNMLFATDLSKEVEEKFAKATALARHLKATINAFHAKTPNVAESIVEQCKDWKTGILCIPVKAVPVTPSPLANTQHLIKDARLPLLVLH